MKFLEYYDDYKCDSGSSSCHFYFKKLIISVKKGAVLNIGETSSKTDKKLVNLKDVPELKSKFTFDLTTNPTVYISLEVWDEDGWSKDDEIRTISNLVIPFHEITTNTGWKDKTFTISNVPYVYLEIQFILEKCHANFRGLGCNFCSENYYTSTCDKYCRPKLGDYTCNSSGNKICATHKTGQNCDQCQKEWGGDKCEECAENYFPEKVCNVTCIAVEGRYTCSHLGGKVCHENRTGLDCDSCTEHRTGKICENCTEGWGGDKCQECAKDYYPEGVCNVSCTGVQSKFTCTKDGRKACFQNWKGKECDVCSENYFGEFCEEFCEDSERYNCSSSGEMVCLDNTTTVENNCGKFSKLSKKPTYKLIIGVVIGTILLVVLLSVVIVLMRRKGKKSDQKQLLETSDVKGTKSEKTTEAGKSAQSSTITSTTLEMTYATLNHNPSVLKSTEDVGHFENATYDTLDRDHATLYREHSIEDNCEQSNYNYLDKLTHQTHQTMGKENTDQGVRRTEDLRNEESYADISIVYEKLENDVEELKINDKIDTTCSSLNHYHNPAAEDEEDSYSHLSNSKSSDRDCCKNDLDEEETYADIIELGQKEELETGEATEDMDNSRECTYATVSFVGQRKECEMLEDNEALTRTKEKKDSFIYSTMKE